MKILKIRKRLAWRAWMTYVCAIAWWGVFYPELCFPEETYQTVDEEDDQDFSEKTSNLDLLRATQDDVVVTSRLLEWLEEYFK